MKRITFFTASLLCISACNNEIINTIDPEEKPKGPSIELHMADATKVSVYSSATESECWIDSVWILEFNSSGVLVNHELIKDTNIINNGYPTQLLPQLSFDPTIGNLLACVANCDSVAAFSTLTLADLSINSINSPLSFPRSGNDYYNSEKALPLYGEITAGGSYICTMTRAVAKVQVLMGTNVSDVTTNFTAENVRYSIHNGGQGGYNIKPYPNSMPGNKRTTGNSTDSYYLLQKEGVTDAQKTAYLYEYPTDTMNVTGSKIPIDTFKIDRQHIILEKDVSSIKTYYRLDFYDPATKKFIATKRNHHYIFTIQKVRSEGYSSDTEAQKNPGSNLEYTLTINDGNSTTSNGQYAIITSVDTAFVRPGAIDTVIATARYTEPQGISLTLTTNSISVTSVNFTDAMTLTTTGGLTNTNKEIRVTTAAQFQNGTITFKLGNITHHLYVKAKP